jgi:hypothetical protein
MEIVIDFVLWLFAFGLEDECLVFGGGSEFEVVGVLEEPFFLLRLDVEDAPGFEGVVFAWFPLVAFGVMGCLLFLFVNDHALDFLEVLDTEFEHVLSTFDDLSDFEHFVGDADKFGGLDEVEERLLEGLDVLSGVLVFEWFGVDLDGLLDCGRGGLEGHEGRDGGGGALFFELVGGDEEEVHVVGPSGGLLALDDDFAHEAFWVRPAGLSDEHSAFLESSRLEPDFGFDPEEIEADKGLDPFCGLIGLGIKRGTLFMREKVTLRRALESSRSLLIQ